MKATITLTYEMAEADAARILAAPDPDAALMYWVRQPCNAAGDWIHLFNIPNLRLAFANHLAEAAIKKAHEQT